MNIIKNINLFKELGERRFSLLGQFLFLDLSKEPELFNRIPVSSEGVDTIEKNESSPFFIPATKLLKSEGLDLMHDGERFVLPQKALVVVFPNIHHVWIPKEEQVGPVFSSLGVVRPLSSVKVY